METDDKLKNYMVRREKELQISFEAMIRFFNNQPDEKFSYENIFGRIGREGLENFSGNLHLLIISGYVYDEGEIYVGNRNTPRFSLITNIPLKLNRFNLVKRITAESDIDRLFRILTREELHGRTNDIEN